MFEEVSPADDAGLSAYVAALRSRIESAGRDRIVEQTEIEPAVLEEMVSGDTDSIGQIHLSEVAAVMAQSADGEDADALLRAAREELLFEMSAAVTDVERLTAGLDTDLDPKEVQAKMEGRFPMTLAEYAALRGALLE